MNKLSEYRFIEKIVHYLLQTQSIYFSNYPKLPLKSFLSDQLVCLPQIAIDFAIWRNNFAHFGAYFDELWFDLVPWMLKGSFRIIKKFCIHKAFASELQDVLNSN